MDMGVVILNWNGLRDTLACLQSVVRSYPPPARVVLVDNGSSDDSVDGIVRWLSSLRGAQLLPTECEPTAGVRTWIADDGRADDKSEAGMRITLIESRVNRGFAGGNNVGIRWLLNRSVSNVALLNNDAVVESDALAKLLSTLHAHPQAAVVVPQIRYLEQPDRIWNCGGEWTWFGSTRYHHGERLVGEVRLGEPFPVGFVTGCALLIRSSWLEAQGLLTERFFFGEEDVDLSWRLRASGRGTMLCCPSALVLHKGGSSADRAMSGKVARRVHLQYLNRLIFLRLAWGAGARWQARRFLTAAYWGWSLIRRFKCGLPEAWFLARGLARDAATYDGVDARLFAAIMAGEIGASAA